MGAANEGIGTPKLLEQLSTLLDQPVVLAYAPPPAGEHIRWRVYAGQQDFAGGTIGEGKTVYAALMQAFERTVTATFRGTGPP